jgi:hypothetical protein
MLRVPHIGFFRGEWGAKDFSAYLLFIFWLYIYIYCDVLDVHATNKMSSTLGWLDLLHLVTRALLITLIYSSSAL